MDRRVAAKPTETSQADLLISIPISNASLSQQKANPLKKLILDAPSPRLRPGDFVVQNEGTRETRYTSLFKRRNNNKIGASAAIIVLAMCLWVACSNPLSPGDKWECSYTLYGCDNIFSCDEVTTYSATARGPSEDEANRQAFEELCDQMNEDGFLDGLSRSRCLSALVLYDFENDCTQR